MARCQQRVQGTVNGVARPAKGRRIEVVANFGAFFAGANVGQQLLADRVFVGLLGVAHGFERFEVALARLVQHFAPQVVVGGVKLAVEADGGRLGGAVEAVGQVVAIGCFLATSLEHAHASYQLVEQVGQVLLGGALAAFHGALGVAAFFGGRVALFLQGGACRFQRDDGVGEFGFVLRGQKGKQRGVVGTLGPGFGDDRFFFGLPTILNPQVEVGAVVFGQAVVVGGGECARLIGFALHHADFFQHIATAGFEQVGAFLLHPLGGGLELGLLGAELVVPGAGFTGLQAVFGATAPGQGHDEAVFVLQLIEQGGQLLAQLR